MEILAAYHTDVGVQKETNQDSLCIEIAETDIGTVAMAMVCDGMGGLAKGELASANVVRALKQWFVKELPDCLPMENDEDVRYRLNRLIQEQNQRIAEYGKNQRIRLGTTLTALFIMNDRFLIAHIGDTRVYRLTDEVERLTEDQTVINREIKNGKLTKEKAKTDPRRNVLLQCVGASKTVEPVFIKGNVRTGEAYLLCSDGFRHQIDEDEIYEALHPTILTNEEVMEQRLKELTKISKQRGEVDNITAILIKL